MRAFFTELKGKTVMTRAGALLGVLDDFIVETKTGELQSMLIVPGERVEPRLFKTDAKGRLLLPIKSMSAVRDVVVVEMTDGG